MKIGLLICTYNRPEYLRQCLASVAACELPLSTEICIIDDNSTDVMTRQCIREFGHVNLSAVIWKHENKSIKDSLLKGIDYLFGIGCTVVTNLDSDAIVAKNFMHVLLQLKQRFPDHIITGFNCLTKNRDGSERHKVLMEGEGFNLKKSVGGINMMFDKDQYTAWIRPALIRCLASQGNWDHQSCIESERSGKEIVCAVPSVVQHIGINSSMNHSLSEPPDVADDFPGQGRVVNGKLQLKNVTLVGADCVDIRRLLRAAEISQEHIDFGDVKMFSSDTSIGIIPSIRSNVVPIAKLNNKSDYSVFMMKELWRHITTDYVLVIQHDGFVLNAKAWRDEWFKYDYIGAPWEWYQDEMKVGNGGFSLRSARLHRVLGTDNAITPMNDHLVKNKEEDHNICRLYRKYLERQHQIKFAPVEEARLFSLEGWNSPNKVWNGEFGFHGHSADISKSNYTRQ